VIDFIKLLRLDVRQVSSKRAWKPIVGDVEVNKENICTYFGRRMIYHMAKSERVNDLIRYFTHLRNISKLIFEVFYGLALQQYVRHVKFRVNPIIINSDHEGPDIL